MSTKNLARTVIEGGRARYSTFRRRYSHAIERAQNRTALAHLVVTARPNEPEDDVDTELVLEPRPRVGRDFRDKLGAAERWLAAQAGRPFQKVHQDLFERFDTRTLAGRHVVFCHLLPERGVAEDEVWMVHRRMRFWVDRHGLLRACRRNRRAEDRPLREARAFAGYRRVRLDPVGYVWAEIRWVPPKWERTVVVGAPLERLELAAFARLSPEARRIVLLE